MCAMFILTSLADFFNFPSMLQKLLQFHVTFFKSKPFPLYQTHGLGRINSLEILNLLEPFFETFTRIALNVNHRWKEVLHH